MITFIFCLCSIPTAAPGSEHGAAAEGEAGGGTDSYLPVYPNLTVGAAKQGRSLPLLAR